MFIQEVIKAVLYWMREAETRAVFIALKRFL
jgi:hypothetical protein